jgi:precorrin-2 dehydrogenase/sirohydrochlorin ferrochelatase
MITISTGGELPALSKRLRQQLQKQFPEDWSRALALLGKARRRVLARVQDEKKRHRCLADLAGLDLIPFLQAGGETAAQAEIDRCISRYLE